VSKDKHDQKMHLSRFIVTQIFYAIAVMAAIYLGLCLLALIGLSIDKQSPGFFPRATKIAFDEAHGIDGFALVVLKNSIPQLLIGLVIYCFILWNIIKKLFNSK
jgi:hypothetical protein